MYLILFGTIIIAWGLYYLFCQALLIPVDNRQTIPSTIAYLLAASLVALTKDLLPPNSRFSLTRVCYHFFRDFLNSRLFDDLVYHQFRDFFMSRVFWCYFQDFFNVYLQNEVINVVL